MSFYVKALGVDEKCVTVCVSVWGKGEDNVDV